MLDKAESKLVPGLTDIESEPSFIDIFTSPWGCNFEDANNNKLTKNYIMVHTTKILAIVVEIIIIN